MNDLMSAGLHRAWKDALVSSLQPAARTGRSRYLDVAGGTGDVAFRILDAGGPQTRRRPCSTSTATCWPSGASARAERGLRGQLDFVEANAEALPFAGQDASTPTRSPSASATCRASRWRSREAYRVLKRGGRFLCLEFSQVDMPLLDRIYDAYSFNVDPGARQGRDGRRRALSLSRGIDPQVPAARGASRR